MKRSMWQRRKHWLILLEYSGSNEIPQACEVYQWCEERSIHLNRLRWYGREDAVRVVVFQANVDANTGMEFKLRWL